MVPKPNWTVPEAVHEVMLAIRQGSTLRFAADEIQSLRDWYTLGFQAQYDKGADWDTDKAVILPLAHWVGVTAALFTSARAALTGSGAPTQVDPECAMRAAHLIALQCHLKAAERSASRNDHPDQFGPYCPVPPSPPPLKSAEDLALAGHLWELWRLLIPSSQRSKQPAAPAHAQAS